MRKTPCTAAALLCARRLRPVVALKDYITDIMQYTVMMVSK